MPIWKFSEGDSYESIQITQHPQGNVRYQTTNITFSVEIVPVESFVPQYQWYFNDSPILNEITSSLILNNLQLGNSGEYFVRIINPENGSFVDSNIAILIVQAYTPIESGDPIYPLCIFYPIGRGSYYNCISIKLKRSTDPAHTRGSKFDEFYLYIYEVQKDKSEQIVETFIISFEPSALDYQGEPIFVEHVLDKYSNILRAKMTKDDGDYTEGYYLYVKSYSEKKGILSLNSNSITDTKQDFSKWNEYCIVLRDPKNMRIRGWIGETIPGSDNESAYIYTDSSLTTQGWAGDTTSFIWDSPSLKYEIRKNYLEIESVFETRDTPIPLRKGSDGSLISQGEINKTVASNILIDAYSGLLESPKLNDFMTTDKLLDPDYLYFSMVFDGGYNSDIKTQIQTLVNQRQDCIAIIDNTDTKTVYDSLQKRRNDHKFDNYHIALYEPYSKVYDEFTDRDIWITPIYHMASLFPRNDRVNEVWNGVAGFDFVLSDIKDVRFIPSDTEKDELYEKQINMILKYNIGFVPWSQLTTFKSPSNLQDINIVRLVLYCKVAIQNFCNNYIFKSNDSFTWELVKQGVIEFLQDIQIDRGLYSFNVDVSADEYEMKQKKFHVNVILKPTKVCEEIELNFFIQ